MAPQVEGNRKTLLWAALIVVATGGTIVFLGRGGEEPETEPSLVVQEEEEVLELAPVLPEGAITDASWRSGKQRARDARADEGESGSILDGVTWHEDEKRDRYDKSVERTMEDIRGLGIYVEQPEDKKSGK
jgi:hypothetical protein